MPFDKLPIPYPAHFDYGPRPYPELGFVVHMAEGTDVAQYLSRNPSRGVSVHYTVEQKTARWKDGEVVRCLPEDRISGSINPDTIRRTDDTRTTPAYGARHARGVLDSYLLNPNRAVITVEVAGRAEFGPTPEQVSSLVALFAELRSRYPRIRPLGHRDFQSVKRCPGRTTAIRQAFTMMGGHGLDWKAPGEEIVCMSSRNYTSGMVCDVAGDARMFDFPDGPEVGTIDPPLTRDFLGTSADGDWALVNTDLGGGRTVWVRSARVSNIRAQTVDTAQARRAALEAAAAAIAAIPR